MWAVWFAIFNGLRAACSRLSGDAHSVHRRRTLAIALLAIWRHMAVEKMAVLCVEVPSVLAGVHALVIAGGNLAVNRRLERAAGGV